MTVKGRVSIEPGGVARLSLRKLEAMSKRELLRQIYSIEEQVARLVLFLYQNFGHGGGHRKNFGGNIAQVTDQVIDLLKELKS